MPTVKQYQEGDDKQKYAYDFFISRGYNPIQASGIVGNLVHESNLNTSAVGDKNLQDNAFGLAQWRKDRVQKLRSMYGSKWQDFDAQLNFVDWELKNTHKNAAEALKTVKNPLQAGQVISDLYERPKKKFYEDSNRQKAVQNIYRKFVDSDYDEALPISQQISNAGDIVRNTLSNITPNLSNFDNTKETSNFAQEEEEETPKAVEEAKTTLTQKQQEKKFLEDFLAQQPIIAQQQEQQIETPQQPFKDITQVYSEVSQLVDNPIFQEGGKIPVSSRGQYDYPDKEVLVPTKNGEITMKNLVNPLLAISLETGEKKILMPEKEYQFKDTKNVLEIPLWTNRHS